MEWTAIVGIVFLVISIVINGVMIVKDYKETMRVKKEIFEKVRQRNRVLQIPQPDPLNQTQFQQTVNQAYNNSLYE